MKVKEVIDIVKNNIFHQIDDVDEYIHDNYGEWLRPVNKDDSLVEYLQDVDVDDEAYIVNATILYKCEDGVVGIHGPYYIMNNWETSDDIEECCTAREYILENRPVYVTK